MTREEIQKELDSLKGTRFDNTPDKFLHFLDSTSQTCPHCRQYVVGSMAQIHIDSCRRDAEIIADVIARNSKTMSIREILRSHGIHKTTSQAKRIQSKLTAMGFVSKAVTRISSLEDPFLKVVSESPYLTRAELSRILGCDDRSVDRLARKNGIDLTGNMGSKRFADRRKMVEMYRQGISKSQIARSIGYHPVSVGRILKEEGF